MSLGPRQREELDTLIVMGIKPMSEGYVRFVVTIDQLRAKTREFGQGMAITVRPIECYPEGEYDMRARWIADCQHDYTAIEKGQEIARYLVDHGIPRDHVKLVQR